MAKPTVQAMSGLRKLTQYLLNTAGYAIAIQANPPGTSKLHGKAAPGVDYILEAFSDADWSGSKKDRRSYGGASFCLNGTYLHYICRAQKSVSLSSMDDEYYAAVGTASQGLFMKAVVEFMAGTRDLIVYLDNISAKSFALRQGVSKAAKHIEGRLLWLQNVVQQQRLTLKFVPTHRNLGDLHTKPLTPARLLALLYMHDMVDACDRPVGGNEYENTQAAYAMKLQVKRSRVCANGALPDTLCKRIALITMMLSMPEGAEACQGRSLTICITSMVSFVIASIVILRALSLESSEAGMLQAIFLSGFVVMEFFESSFGGQAMSMSVAFAAMSVLCLVLCVLLVNTRAALRAATTGDRNLREQLKERDAQVTSLSDKIEHLRECIVSSEDKALQFASAERLQIGAKREMAHEIRGLQTRVQALERELVAARAATGPPAAVYYTSGRGRCYRHESCHHVRNNNGRRQLLACTQCRMRFYG